MDEVVIQDLSPPAHPFFLFQFAIDIIVQLGNSFCMAGYRKDDSFGAICFFHVKLMRQSV